MKHICHLTTVHDRYDTRLLPKQCVSLRKNNFKVSLVVADSLPMEEYQGVQIISIGRFDRKLKRILSGSIGIYKKALGLNADAYQFHDPELLIVALALRLTGKVVVYDIHEDVPQDLLIKEWIPEICRKPLSISYKLVERLVIKFLSGVIAATPHIANRIKKQGIDCLNVNNYPIIDKMAHNARSNKALNKKAICYVGVIQRNRGVLKVIQAIEGTDITFHLAGRFDTSELHDEAKNLKGWSNVNYHGVLSREEVYEIFKVSRMGIVILDRTETYLHSLPVKLFEYLSVGLPVLASDFPLWKDIVEKNDCGVCVDEINLESIRETILKLTRSDSDPIVERFSNNAIITSDKFFSWESEERKYINLYKSLLNS